MTDRKAIEARIEELRGELGRAEGTPTEVYSRIVGYYRSVRNWNAGKREEYGQRVVFGLPRAEDLPKAEARPALAAAQDGPSGEAVARSEATVEGERRASRPLASQVMASSPVAASLRDGVLVFTREACPNCPPVANYVVASGMKAVFVDVDGDEGLALAREHGVMATPTVLALDGEGNEAFRAFDLASLRSKLAEGPRSGLEAR